MRKSVQAVLLCHHNNTIHVLLLEESSTNYILPGGDLKPDESEEDGLKRYLSTVNIKIFFFCFLVFQEHFSINLLLKNDFLILILNFLVFWH